MSQDLIRIVVCVVPILAVLLLLYVWERSWRDRDDANRAACLLAECCVRCGAKTLRTPTGTDWCTNPKCAGDHKQMGYP